MLHEFHSADDKTLLRVDGQIATIVNAETGGVESSFNSRGGCALAAISNHQQWVAAALEGILVDIYIFKRQQDGVWSMHWQKRVPRLPQALQWDESDDKRYPPMELLITHHDGTTERMLPKGN